MDNDENDCNPEFEFIRIDGADGTISTGYNFRTVTYDVTGTQRYLRKYYGLRFIFVTEGIAGQFDFAAMTVTFGAGLAYLGIAAVIADIVLERFLPESDNYVKQKHKDLNNGDPGQISLVAATSEMHMAMDIIVLLKYYTLHHFFFVACLFGLFVSTKKSIRVHQFSFIFANTKTQFTKIYKFTIMEGKIKMT